jgi:hypothetical protein
VPLPAGVPLPLATTSVQLGQRPLQVDSFTTELPPEALMTFYEQELPRAGWQLAPLPWQARHQEVMARLAQALDDRPDLPEAPAMRAMLAQYQATAQALRRQMHATKGEQGLIVNLVRQGRLTAVFLNRWQGEPFWTAPSPSGAADVPAAPSAPRHVLCSIDEVPATAVALPASVPAYPNARVAAQSQASAGNGATVLLLTPAQAADVTAFYQDRMPKQGWRLTRDAAVVVHSRGRAGRILTYEQRSPAQVCVLTIQPLPARWPSRSADRTMVTVATLSLPDARDIRWP